MGCLPDSSSFSLRSLYWVSSLTPQKSPSVWLRLRKGLVSKADRRPKGVCYKELCYSSGQWPFPDFSTRVRKRCNSNAISVFRASIGRDFRKLCQSARLHLAGKATPDGRTRVGEFPGLSGLCAACCSRMESSCFPGCFRLGHSSEPLALVLRLELRKVGERCGCGGERHTLA